MCIAHRHRSTDKLNYPRAIGTDPLSPQRPKSFRHILVLPSPSSVDERRKLPNLRVSLGASAPQLRALCLRIRTHAGACSPAAQRAATLHPGRCVEVAEARSIATFARRCRAFLAKTVLRFQCSKLSAVYGEAALYSPQSGATRLMRTSGGLALEQFSALRNRTRRTRTDPVGMGGAKTGAGGAVWLRQ